MELRGLKINMRKKKYMVSGKISVNKVNWGRWPCGCCGKGVGSNSILCNKCKKWCHKRCSGLKNFILNKIFICPKCSSNIPQSTNDSESSFKLEGNCFDCNNDIERAVRGRIDAAWLSWRNISGLHASDL